MADLEEAMTEKVEGVVHDPTLQDNREMSVIYSSQFKRIMIDRNQSRQIQDPLRSILENSIGDILPKLMAFYVNIPAEEQCSAAPGSSCSGPESSLRIQSYFST